MKLILLPLAVLLLIGVLSMLGLGLNPASFGQNYNLYDKTTSKLSDGSYLYLYDVYGNAVCYANGTTNLGASGFIIRNDYTQNAMWKNGSINSVYPLYHDQSGLEPVKYTEVTSPIGFSSANGLNNGSEVFSLGSSLGFIAIVGLLMGLAIIAGIHIFGSGLPDISIDMLIKGTFFLTLWAIISLSAYGLILQGGFYLYLIYFVLTLVYTVGVINSVGHPQGTD